MSVRKRTWTTARGELRQAWIVDYRDQEGSRALKTFDLKKEADAFEDQVGVDVRAGIHVPDSKSITVAEAGKRWIETGEKNGLERTTLAAYGQHLNLHIIPYLGRLKLSQLTTPMVRDFEDKLRLGKPAPGELAGEKRSAAMVRKVMVSLGSILADAQERGLVAQNVVRGLHSRRGKGKQRRQERRHRGRLTVGVDIPTPGEIGAIVSKLQGRWRPLMLTAIFTGLRASELRGLRWRDLDLGKKTLQVQQRADAYGEIGPPKSDAGHRTIPLGPVVINALREWKLKCPKGSNGLVFPDTKGGVETYDVIVGQGLKPAQVAAGVVSDGGAKYSGLHALRHFYASWCINAKQDGGLGLLPKTVQERMGHSSITITFDLYGHLFPRGDDGSELAHAEQALLTLHAT